MAISWNTPATPTPASGGINWNAPSVTSAKPDSFHSMALGSVMPSGSGPNPINYMLGSMNDAASGGADQINQGVTSIQQGTPGQNPIVGGLEAGLKVGSGIASVVSSPLAGLLKPIGAAMNGVGNMIGNIPGVQKFAASPAGQATSVIAQPIADAGNIAGTIAGLGTGGDAAPAIAATTTDAIKSVPDTLASMVPTPAERAATQATKASSAIADEISNTAAKYPSVSKVLNQSEVQRGTDPVSVLSSYPNGEALPTVVKGKLQTDAPVKFLNSQISRLSSIKTDLVASSKVSTPIQDFVDAATARVNAMPWSAAKKADETTNVTNAISKLQSTYPKGIPSTEMDLLKAEHTAESKAYNSKSAFSPDTHAIIGQAARRIVEKNGGDAPIAELNKLISSHYDAIKLLNSMRGKAPHGGALSKMMNNTLGEVGGLGAGLAVGHPFIGAMVGRAGAEAVTNIINNHFISNPLKRSIVSNMKGADPAVVSKALDYLDSLDATAQPAKSMQTEPPQTQ